MNVIGEELLMYVASDPVEKTVQYLLQYPHTLIRSSRLMRRLQVSVEEFQQALDRLNQQDWAAEN
jgi:hypothetical protein